MDYIYFYEREKKKKNSLHLELNNVMKQLISRDGQRSDVRLFLYYPFNLFALCVLEGEKKERVTRFRYCAQNTCLDVRTISF